MNLKDIDLNLLVILDAIYQEKNLTHAGKKLHLTQSGMSHALNRLRAIFDDQLFIRQGNLMYPTKLADYLATEIQPVLRTLKNTLAGKGQFDPEKSDAVFRLGANDYVVYILLPKLIARLKQVAPNVSIQVVHLNYEQRQIAFERDGVDHIIGSPTQLGSNVFQQKLFRDKEVCIVRHGHPGIGDTLSLEQYIKAEFVHLSLAEYEQDAIDILLNEKGLKRNIRIRVEHELLLPKLVSETDYIANISERLALEYAKYYPIQALPIPIEETEFFVCHYWHTRTQNHPAHKWFRQLLKQLCCEF